MIWDLFPALQETDVDYMCVDNRRRLCHIPPDFATPKAWKDSKILGRSALYIRPKTKINEVVYPIMCNHCKDQIVLRTMTHPGLEMIFFSFRNYAIKYLYVLVLQLRDLPVTLTPLVK